MDEYQGMQVLNPLTGEGFEHYGRKGMKWYQHKFGREQEHARYARGAKSSTTDKAKQEKKEARAAKKQARKTEAEAQRKAKILSDPARLYKHRKEFTKEEINKAMETFAWENQLKRMSNERIQQGKAATQAIVDTFSNGINGYNQFARVFNTFSSNKIPYIENVTTKNARGNQDAATAKLKAMARQEQEKAKREIMITQEMAARMNSPSPDDDDEKKRKK